jgi:ribosomal protein S19E (S16A)
MPDAPVAASISSARPQQIARAVSPEGLLSVEGLQKSYGSRKVVKTCRCGSKKAKSSDYLAPTAQVKPPPFT